MLDVEYAAEMRMVIHFQLLTIVSAKSRVEKESVEFQMFLRENRFKLMANGVTPPASIFRSNSYANIDMKLVANWLIRLTNEQVREIGICYTCWWYSLYNFQYRQHYEHTCSDHFDC